MDISLYSYGNIVRILAKNSDIFANSVMIDVDLDEKKILSLFDAEKKFDADFIQSYLNILRESTVGFRILSEQRNLPLFRFRAANKAYSGLFYQFNPVCPFV